MFQLKLNANNTFDLTFNEQYVSVHQSANEIKFMLTNTPDIVWNGTQLISKQFNKALDIYSKDSTNIHLWDVIEDPQHNAN